MSPDRYDADPGLPGGPLAGDQPGDWPEAMAEVTSCRYDVRAGRAMVFGLTTKKHFRIAYNYLVEGELHTGECFSTTAMPQGTLFPIRYDPSIPRQHRTGLQGGPTRVPLLAIGLAGSLLLSLGWLLFLHGCGS